MKDKYERILKFIKYSLSPVVLIILAKYFLKSIKEIDKFKCTINIYWFFGSLLTVIVCILLLPLIWHLITVMLKCNLQISDSVSFRLYSELGKYLPGRVLGYGYLILKYREKKIDIEKVVVCSYYEIILSSLAAIMVSILCLIFIDTKIFKEYKKYMLLFLPIMLISIHPFFFNQINKLFSKISKRIKFPVALAYGDILIILTLYTIYWSVFGSAFYLFINSFVPLRMDQYFYITGSFALSTFMGFVAFFLPAGLGAREGTLILFLKQRMGNPFASVVSIASRIWIVCSEILVIVIVTLIREVKRMHRTGSISNR